MRTPPELLVDQRVPCRQMMIRRRVEMAIGARPIRTTSRVICIDVNNRARCQRPDDRRGAPMTRAADLRQGKQNCSEPEQRAGTSLVARAKGRQGQSRRDSSTTSSPSGMRGPGPESRRIKPTPCERPRARKRRRNRHGNHIGLPCASHASGSTARIQRSGTSREAERQSARFIGSPQQEDDRKRREQHPDEHSPARSKVDLARNGAGRSGRVLMGRRITAGVPCAPGDPSRKARSSARQASSR